MGFDESVVHISHDFFRQPFGPRSADGDVPFAPLAKKSLDVAMVPFLRRLRESDDHRCGLGRFSFLPLQRPRQHAGPLPEKETFHDIDRHSERLQALQINSQFMILIGNARES